MGLRTRVLSSAVVLLLGCWATFLLFAKHPSRASFRAFRAQYQPDAVYSLAPAPAPLASSTAASLTPPQSLPSLYAPPPLDALAAPTELRVPTQLAGMGVVQHERFRREVHLPGDWHRGWSKPVYLPELRTFFCTHPKSACTTLRSYILMWAGTLQEPSWRAHKMLFSTGWYNRSFIEVVSSHRRASQLLSSQEVTRVAFVREPIARVISMFISKILQSNDGEWWEQRAKLGADRKTPYFVPEDLKLPDYGIHKFIEGLWQWRHHLKDCSYHDEHLTLQSCRCGHRFVDYDFVGRTERLDDDVEEWLKMRGRPDLVPKKQPMNKSNETISETLLRSLTEEDIQRLWEIYEEDYVRFGYPDPRRKFATTTTSA